MSLLVHYTLKDASDCQAQAKAMSVLVEGLKSEKIEGLNYSCFATSEPTKFIGLLEFPDEKTKHSFLNSAAFANYRETVGPSFANPPQTTEITAIATTR